jgi:multiple sugar transport system substrate-binding protein
MPASEHSSEISTILNEEHTLIMTREYSIDEGIEEMNERAAELLG